MWVLGIKIGSSTIAVCALIAEPSLQPISNIHLRCTVIFACLHSLITVTEYPSTVWKNNIVLICQLNSILVIYSF